MMLNDYLTCYTIVKPSRPAGLIVRRRRLGLRGNRILIWGYARVQVARILKLRTVQTSFTFRCLTVRQWPWVMNRLWIRIELGHVLHVDIKISPGLSEQGHLALSLGPYSKTYTKNRKSYLLCICWKVFFRFGLCYVISLIITSFISITSRI